MSSWKRIKAKIEKDKRNYPTRSKELGMMDCMIDSHTRVCVCVCVCGVCVLERERHYL